VIASLASDPIGHSLFQNFPQACEFLAELSHK
jgi:hypothetical protein